MKLDEIAFDLLEIIREAKIVDDERISKRLLYHWIHTQRSLFIKRELSKGRSIDDNILQDYVADLSLVDTSKDTNVPSGEYYLMSARELFQSQ